MESTNRIHACFAAALLSLSSTSFASDTAQGFFELAGGSYTYEEDGILDEFSTGYLEGRFGAMLNPYIGAQVRLGVGLGKDSTVLDFGGGPIDASLKLKNLQSLSLIVGAPIGNKLFIYGTLGFARFTGEITASAGGGSFSEENSDTGSTFGLGAKIHITESVSVVVDHTSINCDQCDMTATTLGVGIKF